MRTTITLLMLLSWGWSAAQQSDSSRHRRLNPFERRRQLIDQQMHQAMQYKWDARERWGRLPLYKVDSSHWSLSFNPLGILEPQSAIGIGVGYQFNQQWQLWLESSFLFQMYRDADPNCIGGVRESLAMKYYFGLRQSLFFAGEFRWKQVYYHDMTDFIDVNTNLLVAQYSYTLENIIFGGAVWFGGRIRISDDHRWRLEPSIGLGLKGRTVVRQEVPDKYVYASSPIFIASMFSASPRAQAPVTFYLPATIRLVYVL